MDDCRGITFSELGPLFGPVAAELWKLFGPLVLLGILWYQLATTDWTIRIDAKTAKAIGAIVTAAIVFTAVLVVAGIAALVAAVIVVTALIRAVVGSDR